MSLPISQDKSVAKPGSGSKAWSSSWPAVATLPDDGLVRIERPEGVALMGGGGTVRNGWS